MRPRWNSSVRSSFDRSARLRAFLAVARTLLARLLLFLVTFAGAVARVVTRRVVLVVLARLVRDGVGAPLAPVARLLRDLPVLDRAAPAARLLAARLDERLEALQVGLRGALVEAEPGRELLDDALGLPVENELDPRQLRRELVEGDHT